MDERAGRRPRVAVVGRPNVGKSTLVNRLAARRGAIVGPSPGLTRDRLDVDVTWRGRTFTLHDTGGLVERALGGREGDELTARVAAQAVGAIRGSDLVLFVVDAAAGVTSDELALARELRRVDPPVLVVANKVDDAPGELSAAELWSLGFGEPLPVSAVHGRGSGDLLDRIVELLPEGEGVGAAEAPSIAIVGRPNVGKSSIFNRLVGEERAVVHPDPGTTRDSVDTVAEIEGRPYRFVDTAGMRRHARTAGVEVYSAARTRAAIARADVAMLVVDAAEGVTHQDQRIAEALEEAGAGVVVVLNKWDLVGGTEDADRAEESLEDRLGFVSYAPLVRTSALTGRGIGRLVPQVDAVLEARRVRVPTSALNELVQEVQQAVPPPRTEGRNVRVLYSTQAAVAPPSFVLFSTGPLVASWLRFLERRLREGYGFVGNPLRFTVRPRSGGRRRQGDHPAG